MRNFAKKHENIIISLLVVLAVIIVVGVNFDYYYQANDDITIKNILSGVYTGTPESRNIQMHYPMSLFISMLYRIGRNVPWYGLFLCTAHFFAFGYIIINSIKSIKPEWLKIVISVIEGFLFAGTMMYELVFVQYTVTCGLLAACGMFGFMMTDRTLKKKEFIKANIPNVVIIVIAFLVRSEMLLLMFPFICIAGLIKWSNVDKDLKERMFSKDNVVKYLSVFAIILSGIPLQGKASRKLEKITGKVRDNIRGIRVIRAFGREDEETRSFDVCNRENAEATVRAGRVSSLMNPLTFAVINIAIIIVVKFSSVRVSAGEMKPGDVVALYNYMGQVLIELVKLANLTLTISRAVSCAGRIKKVLELPDETGCEPVAEGVHTDEVLSFNNVCFRYPGASEDSVSDISFSLKRGESLGILGGTGSGKSTVANLIPGLYKPTKGNITVCGQDTSLVNPEAVRSHVSMVPQSSRLFSGTVADNIRRGNPDADESAVRRALSLACALDFSEEKENGINTEVLSGGSNFSGGQKQRLTIARALIANPDILVLDDCLSALDFRTDLKVRQNIAGLDPKPATVIISQRPSTVLNCDRILVLEDGKCAGYGTADELYESCPLYREIYDSQYSGREAEE